MIEPRHTRLGRWWWETFIGWAMRWSFGSVWFDPQVQADPARAVLILGNHTSWWDGFWIVQLNRLRFRKRFHVMMLESELRKRLTFRSIGAFSIQPGGRGILQSLDYAGGLLSDPRNLVLFFPQGRIHSQYEPEIRFEPGIDRILRKAGGPVQILFFAALTDYFSRPRPSLFVYLQECPGSVPQDRASLEAAYRSFYAECLRRQQAKALPAGPAGL
ncbi:MAG: lysophospholipid acyltransferase family protein [Bacteroidia bacterium]|nr:lysophospholipid acyltransferase family protein [Bacteroidia bacterium]